MNAAESIQAAIGKLTEIRDGNDYQIVNGWLVEDSGVGNTYIGNTYIGGMSIDDGRQPVTNDPMIVTLYATIDAQLLIMRNELEEIAMDKETSGFERPPYRDILELAQAILGK